MPSQEPDARSAWERRFDRKPVSSYVLPVSNVPPLIETDSARNPIYADLDIEHNELAQTWKTFIHHLPPEDRVKWDPRPQAAADVHTLMRQLQTDWAAPPRQRVFRRASALTDKFLPTVDTHASVLAVLPDGPRYHTPLLYAVLQSVIKVRAGIPALYS